jgi:hypothetical protein
MGCATIRWEAERPYILAELKLNKPYIADDGSAGKSSGLPSLHGLMPPQTPMNGILPPSMNLEVVPPWAKWVPYANREAESPSSTFPPLPETLPGRVSDALLMQPTVSTELIPNSLDALLQQEIDKSRCARCEANCPSRSADYSLYWSATLRVFMR